MSFLYVLKGGALNIVAEVGCLLNGYFPFVFSRGTGVIPDEKEAFLLVSVCSLLAAGAYCSQQCAGHLVVLIPREFQHVSPPHPASSSVSDFPWRASQQLLPHLIHPQNCNQNHLFKTQI